MVFLVLPDCEEPDRLLAALQAAEIMGALEVIEILLYNNGDKWQLPEDFKKALEETYVALQELLRATVWPLNLATTYINDLAKRKLQAAGATRATEAATSS